MPAAGVGAVPALGAVKVVKEPVSSPRLQAGLARVRPEKSGTMASDHATKAGHDGSEPTRLLGELHTASAPVLRRAHSHIPYCTFALL